MKNPTNEHCCRCNECGYIYDKSLKSCPKCDTPNGNAVFEQAFISESSEPVFNIND